MYVINPVYLFKMVQPSLLTEIVPSAARPRTRGASSITFPIEHVHSLMIFMNSGPTAYHICNKSILCMIIIAFYGLLCTAGLYGLQ